MIEFFVFMGCFVATAIWGVNVVYLGLLSIAAFLFLYIFNKKYKSEHIKKILTISENYCGAIGLFVAVIGILFISREPLDEDVSKIMVSTVQIVGVSLFLILLLSPLALCIYNRIKGVK